MKNKCQGDEGRCAQEVCLLQSTMCDWYVICVENYSGVHCRQNFAILFGYYQTLLAITSKLCAQ